MRPWCSGEDVRGGNDHFTYAVPDIRGMLFKSMICVCLIGGKREEKAEVR